MSLPTKIVDINTATLPDHKNVTLVGPQRVAFFEPPSDDGSTFYRLGDTKEYAGMSYKTPETESQWGMSFNLQRVGSPTFSVRCQVYKDNGSDAPDFSQLVTSSFAIASSAIPTTKSGTTANVIYFHFLIPYIPDNNQLYWFLLQTSAAGDSSNYIKVWGVTQGTAQTYHGGSRPFGSSTWTGDSLITALINDGSYFEPEHLVFLADKTNNKVRAYKSNDGDVSTWVEQDATNARPLNTQATQKSFFIQQFPFSAVSSGTNTGSVRVIYTDGATPGVTDVGFSKFSYGASNVWGNTSVSNLTGIVFKLNVSGVCPLGGGIRTNDSEAVVVCNGLTESNMGSPWRRIKLQHFTGGSWSAVFDVAGSTNTPNSTLPGVANHYDLRWAGIDPNGDCHILYSVDSSNTIQYRKFKANGTFTTINTLNGAVALATANYPIGNPVFYFKDPDWYIAVPYVDSTSSTLKVARCKTTITETSANWTVTQAVAANAETTASIPAFLAADNGGKLFLWRVKPSTRDLAYTNDGGSNTWATEQNWRSGQVCGGIAGFVSGDGIDLIYLEEGTTPDEMRYDHL